MKQLHLWLSMIILVLALLVLIADLPPTAVLRNISFDAFQQLRPRVYKPAPVRIIDIDDESLNKFGQWPWPRTMLADLIDLLTGMGASAIVFDIVFAEPDRTSPDALSKYWPDEPGVAELVNRLPDHDQVLAEAMKRSIVVTGFSSSSKPLPGKLPELKGRFVFAGDDPKQYLFPFKGAVKNLSVFENAASGNGAFNFTADYDGVIRHVSLMTSINNTLYPTLSAEALRVAQGAKNFTVKSSGASGENRFGGHTGITGVRIGDVPVTTDPNGEVWLHFSDHIADRYIPVWKVLSGKVKPGLVEGNILFIGTTAKGLFDLRFSPLRTIIPGVEIHAQMVEQLIQNTYLIKPDWSKAAVIIFLFLMGTTGIILGYRINLIWLVITGLGSVLITLATSWFAFTETRLFFDPLFPSLTLTGIFLVCGFSSYLKTELEGRWIHNAFSRYISPNLVKHIIKNPDQLILGGEKRECTFVLTDLAGFTPFMEKSEPAAVVDLLNNYLEEMLQIAFRHDATVDRIVGDSIAVMFSAPVTQPDHASRAIACALEMDAFSQKFSQARQKEGIPLGMTRIGVHTGVVLVGNFGGKTMFDYRALGDPINTTSRLETVNKHLGSRICVSGATAAKCPVFSGRPVGTLILKGKSKGIEAFEPLTKEEVRSSRVKSYMEAFHLLEGNDPKAKDAFAAHVRDFPDDSLSMYHLKRLEKGETGKIITMTQK